MHRQNTNILKVLQQVCDSLTLVIREDGFIQAITGLA